MRKSKAFTLIELMVVVSIIAFLSSLAIPAYFKYLAKAKQAEVAMNLASLHSAQQMFFAENGRYTSDLTELGWKPAQNTYYTYGFYDSGSKENVNYFLGKLNTPANNLKKAMADHTKFVASAAGNLTWKNIDIWAIDENRNIEHLQNGLD